MAGYSETPLLKKLGIKETSSLYLINVPGDYFELLGSSAVKGQVSKKPASADVFHLFVQYKKDLEKHFHAIITEAKSDAVIWVSWYKKSSKIPTDITEDTIRAVVLPEGWVDVKVCAVSDIWSGLKIVKRLKNR